MQESIKDKAVKGVSWTGLQAIITQVYGVVVGVILARLLPPEAFGLIGMIAFFVMLATIFVHSGLNSALIQKKDVLDIHLCTVFWFNVVVSIIIWIAFIFLAPYIASFYNEPSLEFITRFYPVFILFNALTLVPTTILEKKLEFRKIAIANIVSTISAGIVAVIMAYMDMGIWAIIANVILHYAFLAIAIWVQTSWIPKFNFSLTAFNELIRFGLNVTGTGVLGYFSKQIDSLLVGKGLGAESLGIYNKAYTFLVYPINQVKSKLIQVIFPIFSLKQDDLGKLKEGAILLISTLSLILFPCMLGLFSIAEEFVLLLLGKAWEQMIPLIKIFCIASLFEIIQVSGVFFLVLGKDKELLRMVFVTQFITIIFILIGLQWGLIGVALGVTIGTIFRFLVDFYFLKVLVDVKYLGIFFQLLPVIIISILMAVALFFLDEWFFGNLNLVYRFFAKISIGGVIVALQLIIFRPKAFLDLMNLLPKRYHLKKSWS